MGWIIASVIALVFIIQLYNRIHLKWFYRPSREEVANLLARSLTDSQLDGEIDYFISMPIKHDSMLEQIRLDFSYLFGPQSFERSEDGNSTVWKSHAQESIREMLNKLHNDPTINTAD